MLCPCSLIQKTCSCSLRPATLLQLTDIPPETVPFLSVNRSFFFFFPFLSMESTYVLEYTANNQKTPLTLHPLLAMTLVFSFSLQQNFYKGCSYLPHFPLSFLLEHFNKNFILTMTRKQLLSGLPVIFTPSPMILLHFLFYMNLSNINRVDHSLPGIMSSLEFWNILLS